MSASHADPARWAIVSPWLDRLLDADAAGRGALLAQAAAQDAALATELAALLARLDAQDDDSFMQTPAPHSHAAADAGAAQARSIAGPAGQRVGAYVVQHLLGQGGMGSVWLAQRADGRYDGQVAIKFLHGGLFGRGDARRFAREGQILARLDHPHIARLLDAGLTETGANNDTDGQPYLVLEFVQGRPIDAYVQEQGLDVRATVALFMDVLAAVAHAHERLTLHRDLKPSNILVTPQGQVKLLDFGIAKLVSDALDPGATQLTQQAGRAFTLRYAAPEQVENGDATTATDVYALGVLLHVLLTGGMHPTATADTDPPLAQLHALVHTAPRKPSDAVARHGGAHARRLTGALQGDLDTIVGRALKKQPAERYRNAADMADDLRRYLHHEPIAARPDSLGYRTAKFVRRNRWGVAAGTAVVLALGTGTGLALRSAQEAGAQRVQAESLVDFMLGDLRAKLEPVGRLDVLDAVAARALAYYDGQAAADLGPDALGRRARALLQLASLASHRQRLDAAEQLVDQALAITTRLVARFPQQAQRLTEHADTLAEKASIVGNRMRHVDAIPLYQQVLDWQQRALALRPGDAALQLRVADAWFGIGNNFVEMDRPADALAPLRQALASALPLVAARPETWAMVVDVRSTLGDALYRLQRYAEAVDVLTPHWTALQQVPGGDINRTLQTRRAEGMNRLAGSLLRLGRLDEADRTSREVVSQFSQLVALDPSNLSLVRSLCFQRLQWAEIQLAANDRPAAQAVLAQVSADLQRLLAAGPDDEHYQFSIRGWMLELQAVASGDDRTLAELQRWLDDVVPAFEARAQSLDTRSRIRVAAAGLALGDLLAARGRRADALQRWTRAQSTAAEVAAGGTPAALAYLAQLQLRLGDRASAVVLSAQLQAVRYDGRMYIDLLRRLNDQGSIAR